MNYQTDIRYYDDDYQYCIRQLRRLPSEQDYQSWQEPNLLDKFKAYLRVVIANKLKNNYEVTYTTFIDESEPDILKLKISLYGKMNNTMQTVAAILNVAQIIASRDIEMPFKIVDGFAAAIAKKSERIKKEEKVLKRARRYQRDADKRAKAKSENV